ncbi:hypothetical protein HJG60_009668 [Phyllostomus discolor]|uniref:Uncharacterized protein n=1 Tax=Phyllostomus discolor TaxID=89673 RepID=A0A834B884_9CHIR|nr:hypothetical protein HJG60_009668 [Phyllostomus discolor]
MRTGPAEAGTRALGAQNDISVLESSWGRGEERERGSKGRIQGERTHGGVRGWLSGQGVPRAGNRNSLQGQAGRSQAGLQPWEGRVELELSDRACLPPQVGRRKGVATLGDYNLFRQIRYPWEQRPNKGRLCVRPGQAACRGPERALPGHWASLGGGATELGAGKVAPHLFLSSCLHSPSE